VIQGDSRPPAKLLRVFTIGQMERREIEYHLRKPCIASPVLGRAEFRIHILRDFRLFIRNEEIRIAIQSKSLENLENEAFAWLAISSIFKITSAAETGPDSNVSLKPPVLPISSSPK